MIAIKADMKAQIDELTAFEKTQLPFAIARTLTKAAQVAKADLEQQIAQHLDRPNQFTTSAVYFTSAKKGSEDGAEVGIKDMQAKYLQALFVGGPREAKRYEIRVRGRTEFAAPSSDMPLDSFGNPKRSFLAGLLRDVDAKRNGAFVTDKGIFSRTGKTITPWLYFTSQPRYKKMLSLQDAANAAQDAIPDLLEKALSMAVSTARMDT